LDLVAALIGRIMISEEIRKRAIVRESRYLRVAAMRAVHPCAYPGFRPRASILRAAGVGRLGFVEAEFHRPNVAEVERFASSLDA
jgi:hypothetical protein